jgi:hypothetical protein
MQKCVLELTMSALILACGSIAASAQQGPMTQQQPQILQQQQERQVQGIQAPRRGVENCNEDDPGWGYHRGWGRGMGMMGRGGMMGPGGMGHGMMMRMLFAMMDGDGDGTVSLQEFQAAHERIFEEIQSFLQGTRTSVPDRRPR